MASAPSDSEYRLLERKYFEINAEIGRPEASSQTRLIVKQLRNMAIPMSPPKIPPWLSSVPKDGLSGKDESPY